MKGVIKTYFPEKGFGFIEGADGEDYFFHFSHVKDNVCLVSDVIVGFDPVDSSRGLQADNVKVWVDE